MRAFHLALGLAVLVLGRDAMPAEPIRLLQEYSLSPDGDRIYFAWRGDLWSHPVEGGRATRLTVHPATERYPQVSPDGKWLAFTSNRSGVNQVYRMPIEGGRVEQVTFHTDGNIATDWFPDGKALLIKSERDHFWRRGARYFVRPLDESRDRLVFDGYASSARLSPDGKQLLFMREGVAWWRKNYRGPQAGQIWRFEFESRRFERLSPIGIGERSPLWTPDGTQVYFVSQRDGAFNLYRQPLGSSEVARLTSYKDDGVLFPALSRNGKRLVYRVGFDLFHLDPTAEKPEPRRLDLRYEGDELVPRVRRERLTRATQVAFSDDAREIAFAAGGDIWVMDTELREPRRVTNTPEEERDPVFAPDHGSIVYVSETDGACDLWVATRADANRHWWQNTKFENKRITQDPQPEFAPRFIAGGRIAFTNLRGDLWTMNPDGTDPRIVLDSWDQPSYDFSPGAHWVAYAIDDNDFNRDIWIRRADGSGDPVNITRHPDYEGDPVFSPDGKMLAFIGRRNREESDIHFVYLRKADDDQSRRDRKVEKAEKKMKGRKQARPKKAPAAAPAPSAFEKWLKGMGAAKPAAEKKKPAARKSSVPAIDFDGISERIRRVSLPGVSERNLFWSHDSKKLCFRATIDGKEGIYTISPPDDLKPKLLSSTRGGDWRWLKEGNQIVGLAGGAPTSLSSKGRATGYPFRIENELDLPARHRAAFEMSWRIMRDQWYDPALNNRDWNAVREKYLAMAGDCLTVEELDQVVDMMLGELNGSHLNFSARDPGGFTPPVWQERTPHFGVRFDEKHAGPGLKVAHVIEGGPAWRKKSRIDVGDVILQADGRDLDPARDYARQLNGPAQRDIVLRVRNKGGKERDVVIRPASGGEIRRLLYDEWIEKNRRYVDERSKGTLGYLHVRGMNWSSFERFEAELYKVGHGKDGLVIDVRENGGGFTADHLLTVLCQPVHAVTVPRGGRAGYPQGRLVYARWHRPIIVLCNQNSFSNAEIFSHAIKTLERGRLVGVQTAGGVISTGGTRIMGFGFLRLPFRGWFVAGDGQDMELAGAVPDVVIWPQPEEWAKGVDRQLSKGIDLLLADVQTERERPRPPLRYRTGGEAQREDPRETRE